MSLVTSEEMLLDAQKGGYAIGAFNVENMEMIKAVTRLLRMDAVKELVKARMRICGCGDRARKVI